MISTIVTSITSVTSTTTSVSAMLDFGMILGLVAVIALIAFLCVKELATASRSSSHRSLAKFLDIGMIPLIIVFAMIVIMKVVEILA